MRIKKAIAGVTAAAAALAGGVALATPTQAAGPSNLAEVLGVDPTSGTGGFDRNKYDFDILREAAEAVLAKKPGSPVGLLATDTALTAFIPNDRAFQVLERSLTGSWERKERKIFNGIVAAASTLGDPIDVIEEILLYHVLPNAAVESSTVLSLKGASKADRTFTMANGGDIRFHVLSASKRFPLVFIADQDRDALNPWLVRSKLDIEAGNQIAHGISLVLRPLDLPRG
jgi:hypothetical protein